MRINLLVVEQEGGLLFKAPSGILFDCLTAHKLMVGGKLTLVRRGKVYDEGEIGDDSASKTYSQPAFLGLGHLYSSKPRTFDFSSQSTRIIDADELKSGDIVVITMPRGTKKNFNFDRILRSLWKKKLEMDAFSAVLGKAGGSMLAGELANELAVEVAKQPKEKLPQLLRFKPDL